MTDTALIEWENPETFDPGDRVILTRGEWQGQAGVVLGLDYYNSMMYQQFIYQVFMENEDRISINGLSMIKSIYQNEPLEEVPSID